MFFSLDYIYNVSLIIPALSSFCYFVIDPVSVELNIDGKSDVCAKDINFIFTGFTLFGKVQYEFTCDIIA